MMSAAEIQKSLGQFTGTIEYHRLVPFTTVIQTDSVKHLAEVAEAHWLVSDLSIAAGQPKFRKIPFQLWTLCKTKDGGANLHMQEDVGTKILYRQHYDYTTFPLDQIKLYVVDGALSPEGPVHKILMLPSEY